MTIEGWAPRAARVRLRRPGRDDVELTATDAGWWRAPLTLAPGAEYGFVLGDADAARPAPRSRRQPRGVHDLSAWDDPASFAWTDQSWTGRGLAGDRLSETLSFDRLAVAAVLTLTAPGTPMLFMGEEWGASTPWQFFTSHPEPELAEATRRGRRAEFAAMGWDESLVPDPNDPATFERSKLDWSETEQGDHRRLLQLYRALARLRREQPELTDPSRAGQQAECAGPGRWVLHRDAATIYVNLSPQEWAVDDIGDEREVWIATTTANGGQPVEEGPVVLSPDSAAVIGGRRRPRLERRFAQYRPVD